MRVTPSRAAWTAVTAGLVLLMTAGPAAAHVTVNPNSAEAGSYAKLTFRVPTEKPDSATTKVEVVLPDDQPISSVSVRPVPGWKVETQKRTLDKPLLKHGKEVKEVVSRIVWSGGEINPGEFQEFDVSVGPLPEDAERLVFKALQTYDNGEVVRWIDVPAADGAEAEKPAPILALTPAAPEGEAADAAASTPAPAPAAAKDDADTKAAAADEGESDSSDTAARLLGGAGLLAGLVGVGVAVAARRRTDTTPAENRG